MTEGRTVGPPGDPARLRQINERAILDLVMSRGELRAGEIATLTGLTRASVVAVLDGLAAKGWVAVEEPVAAGRGRPARRYRFRATAGYVAGVDIGAHTLRAAVADLGGSLVGSARSDVSPGLPRADRLAGAVRLVRSCLRTAGLRADQVWATCVGTTGLVTGRGLVECAWAIPDWAGVDLAAELADGLPGVVVVENDIRLATFAEGKLGAAADVDDFLLVQAGHRVGLAGVLDGRLRRGHGGVAGDVSRLSAGDTDRVYRQLAECDAGPAVADGPDRVAGVLAAAVDGNDRARTAVRRYARAVAGVTALAVSVLDPRLVVLGGVLAPYPSLAVPELTAELGAHCMRTPEIRTSALGADAVVRGAICRAHDHLTQALLGTGQGGVAPLGSPPRTPDGLEGR